MPLLMPFEGVHDAVLLCEYDVDLLIEQLQRVLVSVREGNMLAPDKLHEHVRGPLHLHSEASTSSADRHTTRLTRLSGNGGEREL